ncbi:FHA domain-containing protein [Saccharopolyspora rhizosphaerae]|uniref:FHA domain-containing protein n=1 Tax=Saccharopolyspora rhizosphaerae TaxID=2492662 RepID=A0A3R8NWW5_9PSEU|nr:FHA domain-containing protein [Saccharopolyspora rhizosphaerae]RRO14751.1 FHA domain-containing protein [Saccharopolyspora rhizosphaerae]
MEQTRIGTSAWNAGDQHARRASVPHEVPAPRAADELSGKPRLVINRGNAVGSGFVLQGERTTIGRDSSSDIVIDDFTVSKHHAEVRRRGDDHVLVDGGSLNGTYLNRLPVDTAVLHDGDEIWVGKARFTYRTGL